MGHENLFFSEYVAVTASTLDKAADATCAATFAVTAVVATTATLVLLFQLLLSNLTTFQVRVGLLRHLDSFLDSSDI